MRSVSLFAVLGLVLVLVASSFSPVVAQGGGFIEIRKVTTNNDTTTRFIFDASGATPFRDFALTGAGTQLFEGAFRPGEYTITEEVPEGWVLDGVDCVDAVGASWNHIPGGIIITISCGSAYCYAVLRCTFTNSPEEVAVGGVVLPANNFSVVAPWLAIIGLVGCIGTIVAVRKKRHP